MPNHKKIKHCPIENSNYVDFQCLWENMYMKRQIILRLSAQMWVCECVWTDVWKIKRVNELQKKKYSRKFAVWCREVKDKCNNTYHKVNWNNACINCVPYCRFIDDKTNWICKTRTNDKVKEIKHWRTEIKAGQQFVLENILYIYQYLNTLLSSSCSHVLKKKRVNQISIMNSSWKSEKKIIVGEIISETQRSYGG